MADFELPAFLVLPCWEVKPVGDEESTKPKIELQLPAIVLLRDRGKYFAPEARK